MQVEVRHLVIVMPLGWLSEGIVLSKLQVDGYSYGNYHFIISN